MKKCAFLSLFFLILIAFVPASSSASSRNYGIPIRTGNPPNHFVADAEPDMLPDQDPAVEEEPFHLEGNRHPRAIIDPFILFPGDMKKMIDPEFCLGEADASLDPGIIIKQPDNFRVP